VNSKNKLDDGWTAIHYAAKEGDMEVVKLLIESFGADFTVISSSTQRNALHLSAIN
jgi:ankyrin repeat protein